VTLQEICSSVLVNDSSGLVGQLALLLCSSLPVLPVSFSRITSHWASSPENHPLGFLRHISYRPDGLAVPEHRAAVSYD